MDTTATSNRPVDNCRLREMMENQWIYQPLRSATCTVGWTYQVAITGPTILVACRMTLTVASKDMRKRFTDMRYRFIQSLYRGKYARI